MEEEKCIIENCFNVVHARGLCMNDYASYRAAKKKGLITEEQALKRKMLLPAIKATDSKFMVQWKKNFLPATRK